MKTKLIPVLNLKRNYANKKRTIDESLVNLGLKKNISFSKEKVNN
jgi:hypothetical protein